MIASLPMYLRPSNKAAHDALWARIRDNLRAHDIPAPDALDHEIDCMDGWGRPDLTLGQICNLPYRAQFRDKVTVIGAADYVLPDCAPGYYRSVFVVRGDDPRQAPQDFAGARFAYNDPLSNSGLAAPHVWAAARGFSFRYGPVTGSHNSSITAVAENRADIAAIDLQTWLIEEQDHPLAGTLRVIGTTDQSPGMTFITRAGQNPQPYLDAISSAIAALAERDRTTLNLRGIIQLAETAYDIPLPADILA